MVLEASSDHEIGFYIMRSSIATSDVVPAAAPSTSGRLGPLALRPPGEEERDDWSSFAVVTSMLAEQRQAVPPAALLSLVEAHRECLLTLYRKAAEDRIGADIGAMLGEASIVASRLWSAQGNHTLTPVCAQRADVREAIVATTSSGSR